MVQRNSYWHESIHVERFEWYDKPPLEQWRVSVVIGHPSHEVGAQPPDLMFRWAVGTCY